ncbi:efflux transporter outer membrane subunit [Novosphingobium sp. NBM11]|uniref:efflux transporter outer membrane subunit n=1 Tax=Novosphingobium sp. NBM11 TaxID=2596914 RepID=UPI002102641B|nr:efflux transporter outer membrane subunit [Novosphingobium sp. NBM11]MBF5091560.1 efflux transporter outer membrane subunit [Novosphingobium sp. NBM11]
MTRPLMNAALKAALLIATATPALAAPVKVDLPQPPTPAGNAPASVLDTPIAPQAGTAQAVHPGTAVDGEWWKAFGSPALDGLVAQALAANNDIQVAQATLKQASELTRVVRGGLFPQIDAGYQASRQRVSQVLSSPLSSQDPSLFTLHTAQVNLTYTLDLFGETRSRIRSAQAAARAQQARLAGVKTMVAGNTALAVIQNAALEAQAAAARSAVASNRDILNLLRQRQALGAVGAADVAAQEAALAAAEGALPPLDRALSANRSALQVLLGVAPGAPLPALPSLDALALPGDLPLSLPSDLVATRPDVVAAAATMEGAAADVKTAIAARLPSITLGANAGGAALDFASMFASGNPFWALIGSIGAPLFHGGSLRHQQHAAEDALEAAKANYRATALQSFADVSNALTALQTDGAALDAADRGDRSASTSLGFATRQLQLGAVGTLSVLNASATQAAARQQLITARAARLTDTVGLFMALGGGQIPPVKVASQP